MTATLQENAFFCGSLVRHPLLIGMTSKLLVLVYNRLVGFEYSFVQRLRPIRMGISETGDSRWGRMSDMLIRMSTHQIPNNFLRNVFI